MSNLLRFDSVTLRRGGRTLFKRVDLALAAGQALQVLGPNGSGKSSLLRLAAGLLRQEEGTVERSQVALADDSIALDRELALSAALEFWNRDTGDALAAMGISHLAPIAVRLLSSGQLKRATLARVIASGAPLWLLDEPLNALDNDGASGLAAALDAHLSEGGAVLAASHQPLPGYWKTLELGS